MHRFPLLLAAALSLTSCAFPEASDEDFELAILHINDHHSRLDPTHARLSMRLGSGHERSEVTVSMGGFARVVSAMDELTRRHEHVLRLHAGDAITGSPYFSLEQGRADADLMNVVCFDAFAVGNHEFDAGDAGLARFVDFLWQHPGCRTPVLSANIVPREGSPIGQRVAPSTVVERGGKRIGIIGLTVSDKTTRASRPDPGTLIGAELPAAQTAIDALRADGIDKIVLLSHVGYRGERLLATRLSGVDVIVGGDSHSLLGDAALSAWGLPVEGRYPTIAANRDGDRVCIVQAWQHAAVVGELRVRFTPDGRVRSCSGMPHVLIGEPLEDLDETTRAAIRNDLAARAELRPTAESAAALAVLEPYRQRQIEFGREVIADAAHDLCMLRTPGTQGRSRTTIAACATDPHPAAHGGDVQQIAAAAFLSQARHFGGGDASLSNGGGVRSDVPAGPLTVGAAYTLLPFQNTLVRLKLRGSEVRAGLEDGFEAVAQGNTGAWPYSDGLRWQVDMTRPRGERISALEWRRADGQWVNFDDAAEYRLVTNDFLADGRDGYDTLAGIRDERREDTGLSYTEAFIDHARRQEQLRRPDTADFSTQAVVEQR